MLQVLGISNDEISKIIKEITGTYDDAFQDAWVQVLELNLSNSNDIRAIARECYKKYRNESIGKKGISSLDAPLSNEPGRKTLKDIIPAIEGCYNEMPGENNKPCLSQPNKALTYQLHKDSARVLKDKYPLLTYTQAIRQLLGLSVYFKKYDTWQEWEDEIIRKYYPEGGSYRVNIELVHRTRSAINCRASMLKIKFKNYRLSPEILTTREVVKIFRFRVENLYDIVRKREIVRAKPFKSCVCYFIQDIIKFIKTQPFKYRHDKICREYREYVPDWVWEWKPTQDIAEELNVSHPSITRRIKEGLIPCKKYRDFFFYVRIKDAREALEMKRLLKQPYKVGYLTLNERPTHYIFQNDEGDWQMRCKPNGKCYISKEMLERGYRLFFKKGSYPTCKVCLSILKTYRILVMKNRTYS